MAFKRGPVGANVKVKGQLSTYDEMLKKLNDTHLNAKIKTPVSFCWIQKLDIVPFVTFLILFSLSELFLIN